MVRRYSSEDEVFRPDPATITIPLYWFRPPMTLATTPGMHRFTWDVHYQPIDGVNRVGGPTLPIAAVGHNTVPAPTTPWANPGSYTVRLTVNGKAYSQPIVVKQDPRVKTSALAMQQVYSLSKATYDGAVAAQQAVRQAGEIRDRIAKMQSEASGARGRRRWPRSTSRSRRSSGAPCRWRPRAGQGSAAVDAAARRRAPRPSTLSERGAALAGVMTSLQDADVQPTTMQLNAIASARAIAARVMARWTRLRTTELAALNATLKSAGMTAIVALDSSSPPK